MGRMIREYEKREGKLAHAKTPAKQIKWNEEARYAQRIYPLFFTLLVKRLERDSGKLSSTRTRQLIHKDMMLLLNAKIAFLEGRLSQKFYLGVESDIRQTLRNSVKEEWGESFVSIFDRDIIRVGTNVFMLPFFNPGILHAVRPAAGKEHESN